MKIKEYLKSKGIEFRAFKHNPVYTVEEAKRERVYAEIKGIHSKNLFLKERKSKSFYLVIMPENKPLDIKQLGEKLGNKIKFGNEEDLKNRLGVTPGSVSPFGLINNGTGEVEIIIDKEVWDSDFVSFHPNINTETLELSKKDFHAYVTSLKNKLIIL